MASTTRFTLALFVALATALVISCTDDGDSSAAPTLGPGVVLNVTRGDELLKAWTLDEILALPQQEIEADGDTQTGPWLRDLLAASAVGTWQHATVHGSGEGRAFDIELEIESGPAEGYVLDITRRGTAKLAGQDLPRERWVRDVTEIRIDD
ncbi:MAG: hypothetical protein R3C39_07840 [Dehalococcoidia bacterium]